MTAGNPVCGKQERLVRMASNHTSKPPFLERVQSWASTLVAIIFAFFVSPFVARGLMPHVVAFAEENYGVGILMPFIVWPLVIALMWVLAATILKVLLSRETLRLIMPSR